MWSTSNEASHLWQLTHTHTHTAVVVVAYGEQTQTEGQDRRIPQTFPQSLSVFSLETIPGKQLIPVSPSVFPRMIPATVVCHICCLSRLTRLNTGQPKLKPHPLTYAWHLTSDGTPLWGSAGRYYTLTDLSVSVSTALSSHSYAFPTPHASNPT